MDTGLQSLAMIARFYQLPTEPGQLVHELGQPREVFMDKEQVLMNNPRTQIFDEVISAFYRRIVEFFLAPLLRHGKESLRER